MKVGHVQWIVLSLALAACSGHAEVLRRDRSGGILALKGVRDKAMADANRQMKAHCRGPFAIVLEENAVVGQQTQASERTQGNATHAAVVTTGVKEYQVTYACGEGPGEPSTPSESSTPSAVPAAAGGRAADNFPDPEPAPKATAYPPPPEPSLAAQPAPPNGHEGIVLAARGGAAALVGGDGSGYNLGYGFGLVLGYELRFETLSLIPEFSIQWQQFAAKTEGLDNRGFLGIQPGANLTLNLGRFRPWGAAHVGFAHREGCVYLGSDNCSDNGFGFDAAIGGDFALGNVASIGPFTSINFAQVFRSDKWLVFGLSGTGRF